jgi:hypothetical protein
MVALLRVDKRAALFYLKDGRGILLAEKEHKESVRLAVKRYYAWVDSGKAIDPWQSGVASATRFDKPQIAHHKPSSDYDAGRCAEPDDDHALLDWDARLLSLRDANRRLVRWKIVDDVGNEECGRRLGYSGDWVERRWKHLLAYLYWFHEAARGRNDEP